MSKSLDSRKSGHVVIEMDRNEKVYFVCRSEYEQPFGYTLVEHPESDLLEWFQNHWFSDELKRRILEDPSIDENLDN